MTITRENIWNRDSDKAKFIRAYLEAILWTECGDSDDTLDSSYGIDDFTDSAIEKAVKDCLSFMDEKADHLLRKAYKKPYPGGTGFYTPEYAGHDFLLTRNGHGAGFWDRDLGDIGECLTALCGFKTEFPEVTAYVNDENKIEID